jgi:two-component sensor histidine kinase
MHMALSDTQHWTPAAVAEGGDLERLTLLYGLMTRLQQAGRREDIYAAAADSLAGDDHEIPFAALYTFSADGTQALLMGVSGVPPGHVLAPELVSQDAPHPWPLADAMRSGKLRRMGPLRELFPDFAGPWARPPEQALLLPLSPSPGAAARGVLVLGADPRRPRDATFEGFAAEIARRIARALLSMEAMEAERERARSADMLALEVEQRRRIERQQNLLLDELNHRVKNTLATVQAIAIQTLKGADVPARDTFIARLFALSGQHDLLTLGNWEGASLEGVILRALRAHRDGAFEAPRFHVEGPPVHLTPKRALALGMALHELTTNAIRHGALSSPGGHVDVRWHIAADGKSLRLTWRESGGPTVAVPSHKGFGLRLVEQGLAREIGGAVALDFPPQGLVCSWEMTLP